MAITTRGIRQQGAIFQNRLENFGADREGDQLAAARASIEMQIARAQAMTGGDAITAFAFSAQPPGPVFAAPDTIVGRGEVAMVSYETDTSAGGSPDALRFVLLSDVAAGTVIYISDRSWNGTSFAAAGGGEGTYTWTAGGLTTAGTVVTLSAATLATGGVTLSNAGETIYFYQGTDVNTPTRFLFAADVADGNTTFNGSLANTGLTNGVNAVAVQHDNATYVGAPTGIAQTMLTNISTTNSWYGNDTDDNLGTPNYTEVTDTTVPGPFFDGNDFVILSALVGGGQSDTMLRIGAEDGSLTAQNVARLFRDNPAFNHVSDVSFDLDSGFFFFVDSDFNSINRIMRGNIADLVSGNQNPTFTQLFATDGQNNGAGPVMPGEGIPSMEVNHATNKIVWIDGSFTGDFEGGWEVYTMNYDGTGRTLVAVIDTENDTTDGINLFGITGIGDYALRESTNILYIAASKGSIDGLGNATVSQNHIMAVNLTTGVITTLLLDNADPRSINGNPNYDDGRLNPNEGQILALDVDQNTGIIYFITQPISSTDHGGIFSYNPATDDLQELWDQPTPAAFNSLQSFPTGNMTGIEVDEIGGRLFITTVGDVDPTNGDTNANDLDSSIYTLALGAPLGTAPTTFVRIFEPTARGAPIGLEVDYDANLVITTNNATYTESTNGPGSPAGPVVTPFTNATLTDPDQSTLYGAQVAITSGFVLGDTLSFTNSGGITGSYNAATGVVTFTGTATLAQYQTVLNSIRFTNAGDNPTNYGYDQTRTISANAFDGLTWGDVVSVTVNIVGINDAPVNTVSSPLAATEDVAKVITGISVADPDADPAAQDITVTLQVTHGTLTILTNVVGGIQPSDVISGNGTATIVITATQNEINATLANANGLTFTNTLDYNGVATLTITTNDNGLNGNDPGLTGTGTSEQDQDQVTINIAAVNDAPVVSGDGTEDTATILEDQPSAVGQSISSLLGGQYSDEKDNQVPNGGASSPGAFSGIAVTTNNSSAGTGQWQYSTNGGASWNNIGAVADATAKLFNASTLIRFNPALNYNGAEPTLIVHLMDNSFGAITDGVTTANLTGGGTGGATAFSTGTVTIGGSITAVNDAPVNAVGGTLTVAEDSSANNVTGMSISDVDANPATDIFTVTLDVLHGTLNLSTVVPSGVTAGNVTGNGTATIVLTGTINQINATLAAAGGLTYTPTGNYNGSDRVQITTDDGGATGQDPGLTGTATSEADIDSKTITVTAVNDPVTGTAPATLSLAEDATNVAVTGMSISDIDATLAPAGVYEVTLSAANGTLTLTTLTGLTFTAGNGTGNATMTFHGTLAAINTALATAVFSPTANFNGPTTITLNVTDTFGGIVATGTGAPTSDSDIINVTVTAVNDAPVNTVPGAQTINEDATLSFAGANAISVADIDANGADVTTTVTVLHGTLTVGGNAGLTSLTGDGTGTVVIVGSVAEVNNALNGLLYTPAANYNGSDTLTITTDDGGNSGSGGALQDQDTVTINITAQNDTPVVAVQAAVASTEQVAGFIDPAATISDVELGALNGGNGDYGGSTLTVGRNGGAQPQDLLTFGASGAFTVNGSNLEAPGGLVFASFTGGNGTPLVITFNDSATIATQALVNAVVQSLQYTYTGDTPPPSIVMNYSFNDGAPGNAGQGGGGSPIGTDAITINITDTPENVAPTVDLDANDSTSVGTGYTASFTENGAAVLITDSDVTITDPDVGDMIEGATIAINSPVAGDLLVLGPQGGFTVTGSGTATITIAGTGTAAQYQAMLAQITFQNTSEDPGTVRTINITVTDGTDTSNIAVSTINITAFNDEPILIATGATPTLTEGGAAVDLFSAVTASTVESGQSFTSLTLTVTNVTDGAFEQLTFDGSSVALTNGNAVTTATNGLNVTVSVAAGTATVTFAGAALNAAQLQTLVDNLAYNNTSENPTDANRVVTITQLVDSGANGGGNDNTANPNISATVNVDPVNDAPVVDLNGAAPGTSATLAYTENQALTSIAPGAVATDVDNANYSGGQLRITITNGLNGEDVLSVVNQGTGAGQIGFNGFTVTYEGTAIGFFAPTGPGPVPVMFIVLNGANVSAAAVNALLGAIGYRNTSENPSTTPRNVEFALFDPGPNVQTGFANATINLTSVNDAPSGTDKAITINEDSSYTFATADFGFSDPAEGNGFLAVKFTTLPSSGTLFYDADGAGAGLPVAVSVGQSILASEIALGKVTFVPNANANGNPLSSFTFQVQDNGGTANGGVDLDQSPNTFTLNVTAVNDAPVNSVPGAQSTNEDIAKVFSTGNGNAISVSDLDAPTLTVSLTVSHGTLTLSGTAGLTIDAGANGSATMTITGTAAAINTALNGLTYTPTANYNGPDAIQIQTSDNGQTGTGGTLTDSDSVAITVVSVNDAPAGTNNTLTGSEDDPVVFTAADFGFTDPNDSPANSLLAVKITTLPGVGTLFLDNDGVGGPNPPVAVSVGQFISLADINAGHLYFLGALDGYGSPYASFTFQVQDNGGTGNGGVDLDQSPNTMTINLTPDDLPPVVDLNGAGAGINNTTSFTEDGAAVAIAPVGTVADQDLIPNGGSLVSMTVTLTDRVAGDSLAFATPLPGGFNAVVTNNAGSIQIVITGTGTGAQYQSILSSIVYATTNQDPTVGNTDTQRTVTVVVNDGTLDSATATTTINIIAVDDAPVAQPDAFTITESGTIAGASLFASNGSGPDSDPDGPALAISAVNGSAGNVGNQILLASGALLKVNANGTFDYDPNGAFLPTPTAGSGASNTPGHDSFSYTLAGGNTVTVSITLTGLDTDDTLLGTAGADILAGGLGNDTYYVENAVDQVFEANGAGNDRIVTSVSYVLAAGTSVETLEAQAGVAPIDLTGNGIVNALIGNDGANTLDGGAGADTMTGLLGDDRYYVDNAGDVVVEAAGQGNDRVFASTSYTLGAGQSVETLSTDFNSGTTAINLTGNELTNLVIGNDGANILDGGAGADTLLGLGGNDYYYVDDAADQVVESAGQGNDRVFASTSYTLGTGVSVETLSTDFNTGTNAINLTGNELVNTIIGNDGDNILNGGAGIDTMIGRLGDDFYFVDNAADAVVEAAGEGNDRVFASTSYTLTAGASVELLTTDYNTGTAAINLTGNELANAIIGNDGNNILDGGAGADTLVGRLGDDFYYVDNSADQVVENAGEGNDRIFSSISYVLAPALSVETLSTDFNAGTAAINLTGNELANTIIGNAGDNSLDGAGGADILVGLGGNDYYYVDTVADQVFEAAGQGNDRVFASTSYTLAAGQSVETLSTDFNAGTNAINLTGNELANTIFGNDGANVLDGGAGADLLVGALGNDFYYVDNAADQVVESVGQGNDTVFASVSYTLGAGQEVEFLAAANFSATTALNLTGNEFANTIYGNDGANVLDGKGGNDLLVGQGGADTFAFTTALGANNVDVVFGFDHGVDKIALDDAVFTAIGGLGALNANAFVTGSAAADASDRIIYNNLTGQLFYDADGTGAGAAIQFATLSPGLTLTASDFTVI